MLPVLMMPAALPSASDLCTPISALQIFPATDFDSCQVNRGAFTPLPWSQSTILHYKKSSGRLTE